MPGRGRSGALAPPVRPSQREATPRTNTTMSSRRVTREKSSFSQAASCCSMAGCVGMGTSGGGGDITRRAHTLAALLPSRLPLGGVCSAPRCRARAPGSYARTSRHSAGAPPRPPPSPASWPTRERGAARSLGPGRRSRRRAPSPAASATTRRLRRRQPRAGGRPKRRAVPLARCCQAQLPAAAPPQTTQPPGASAAWPSSAPQLQPAVCSQCAVLAPKHALLTRQLSKSACMFHDIMRVQALSVARATVARASLTPGW